MKNKLNPIKFQISMSSFRQNKLKKINNKKNFSKYFKILTIYLKSINNKKLNINKENKKKRKRKKRRKRKINSLKAKQD